MNNIAVIGLGYVGLPLARLFATKYSVVGFDINLTRIKELRSGHDETLEVEDEILKKVFNSGKTILLENLNLTKGLDKAKYIDAKVFVNLTDELDRFLPYWDKCSYIVIEQQMSFGKRKNNMNCGLARKPIAVVCCGKTSAFMLSKRHQK